jgi:hypothetical protein
MVGTNGRAEQFVNSMFPLCALESNVLAGSLSIVPMSPPFGGPGGYVWRRQCPPFMALRAIKGRSGGLVDRVQIECKRLDSNETVTETPLPSAGTFNPREIERCGGRGALMALSYNTSTLVDRLGGWCRDLLTSGGQEQVSTSPPYDLQSHGGWGGTATQDLCQSGQALIGLGLRAGALIDAVQGICASVPQWSVLTGPFTTARLPMRGGSGGTLVDRICARGSFLVGWQIGWEGTVSSLQPICRDFQ